MPESTFWTLTRICHRNAYFVDPQQQSGSQNQQVGRRINKVGNRINKMGHRINKWGHHRIDKMGMGNLGIGNEVFPVVLQQNDYVI